MSPEPQQPHEGIYTFLDCPDRWWEQERSIVCNQTLYTCQRWYLDTGCAYICEKLCEIGKCPRGYAR
jgi:hypothetical protein